MNNYRENNFPKQYRDLKLFDKEHASEEPIFFENNI